MKNDRRSQSLEAKDYLSILETISRFNRSRNRRDLLAVLESHFLSRVACRSAFYAFAGPSGIRVIDAVGILRSHFPVIQQYLAGHPLLNKLGSNCRLAVVDRDVPGEDVRRHWKQFTRASRKAGQDEPGLDASMNFNVLVLENPGDTPLLAGFQFEGGPPFSENDLERLERVAQHFLQCVENILREEMLKTFRALILALSDSPGALALVDMDLKVFFCNPLFNRLFNIAPGEKIPVELRKVFKNQQTESPTVLKNRYAEMEIPFFTLPQGVFTLTYALLNFQAEGHENCWYLRIKPATDPYHKMYQLREKSGLTWREMEVCCLIHDGLDRQDISARLFISPHTVRTHLKKIHKKLGVRNRTQLVSFLNQMADDQP